MKSIIKYGSVLLFVITVVVFVFSIKHKHDGTHVETFTGKNDNFGISFFSNTDTVSFLREDKDGYVKGLSSSDLYARKANSPDDYISNIIKCASSFTDLEKAKLTRCAKLADTFLKSYTYRDIINGSDIAKMRWIFAVTRKNDVDRYEEGLPHTRGDVIFLSEYTINDNIAVGDDDMILTSTLIHEKVHIFQRYNPEIIEKTIESMGYKVAPNTDTKLKRSNPDINDKNYYDKNGKTFIFKYNSNRPKNINDVNGDDFSSEHPYETMAYDIADEYTKRNINNIANKII